MGQNYVGKVPSTFTGWLKEPQETREHGRKRKSPPLAKKSSPACEGRNLVKHAQFYRERHDGLPSQAHCLIVAGNVLDLE